MSETLNTKWGTAYINPDGHYQICSRKENNEGRLLHRLIYESVWGKIPEGYVIHHIDGNKTNNCVLNLLMMKLEHHNSLHNKGKTVSLDSCKKHSLTTNTTGYFRVSIDKNKYCTQGFMWSYQYRENNTAKKIRSVDINRLEEKVKAKGLPWIKLTEGDA